MIRKWLLSLAIFLSILPAMAQDGLWSPVSKSALSNYLNGRSATNALPSGFELVQLNRSRLQQLQQKAPLAKPGEPTSLSPVLITLPLPVAGQSLSGTFTESPVLSESLAKQLTDVKTYELTDPVTNSLQGRLTITSQGVTGLIFTKDGTAYINPVNGGSNDVHMVYYVKDMPVTQPVQCGVQELLEGKSNTNRIAAAFSDCKKRNYRLAVAATGEYTTWAGGSKSQALVYIATLINDVTAIYERDAGITFTLVSSNKVIFTDAATDPYSTVSFPSGTTLTENHNTLSDSLGNSSFDQGILLNNDWNGGLASLGSVCLSYGKGWAAAGLKFGTGSNPTAGPQGSIFAGEVAHEMAHQFSATHTMASNNGSCTGNAVAATAYEPGGGSTIMAYAGSCTGNYYQPYSDLYFHGGSLAQIYNFVQTNGTCVAVNTMSNNAPTVTVPAASYTIPISTPFVLTATGADADGNTLTYCWEQLNAGVLTTTTPDATATSGPNFRSYFPTTVNTRYFPRLADFAAGTVSAYEVLPSVARTMNFQVTVRDGATGGGCTAQGAIAVTTNASGGAFTVTSQSTAETWTANGSNTAAITWNVANTTAAPISCSNVDILLSTDGGVTFPDTLATNTANDGAENIIIPNIPTYIARVMVKSRGNIFFNLNTAYITITSNCAANGATFTPVTSVSGMAGSSTLDLSLSPVYGSPVTIAGTLETTDATGYGPILYTNTSACYNYTASFKYDTFRFMPTATGTYTFTRTAGSFYDIMVLNTGSFTPTSPCTNMINGAFQYNGSSSTILSTYTATLTAGKYYTMTVGAYDAANNLPALPNSYTVSVSGPGSLYSATPPPGSGYTYTYVIVDNATGLIKAFDASSDLSDATKYPTGTTYTVYGLSYATAATLSAYIGTSYTAFRNALLYNPLTLCGNLSVSTVQVAVLSALPADMLPLTAVKNGNAVKLKWATVSEANTSYFEVWRSANGNGFDKLIGTVPAQGNSTSRFDYELNDNAPLAAWNYYRVKQVDVNGSSSMGNIARVNMATTNATFTVYPNPVQASLTIAYNSGKAATVRVRVLDSKGCLVYQTNLTAQSGINQYSISANAWSKGVYMIQLLSDATSITQRFIKE